MRVSPLYIRSLFCNTQMFGMWSSRAPISRALAVICLAFILQLVWFPSAVYEGFHGDTAFASSIQSRYDRAKADLDALQRDSKRAGYRDQWERIERTFLHLLTDAKAQKWNNTAAIAYRVAVVRDELARHSHVKADYTKAANTYEDMARQYARSVLADDALLSAALLRVNRLGDEHGSNALLKRLLSQYPKGDMAPTARAILNGGDSLIFPPHRWYDGKSPLFGGTAGRPASGNASGNDSGGNAKAQQKESGNANVQTSPPPITPPKQSGPALPLSKLRHLSWHNGPTTGTVLLDLDREARWRHQFVAGDPSRKIPPRLYIDVDNCRIGGSSVSRGGPVDGSILSALRVDTSLKDHIRIVIDFNAIYSYDVQVEHRNGYALRIIARDKAGSNASKTGPDTVVVPSQGKQGGQSQDMPQKPKQSEKLTPTAPPKDLVEQLGLGIHTIMIDAGHGGKDPGAMGHGLRESAIVLDVALRLGRELKAKGFNVVYTRSKDVFIELRDRTKLANDRKADLFISLHVNASTKPSTNGIETYYYASTAYSNSAAKVAARENGVKEKQLTETQLILTDLVLENKTNESAGLANKVQNSILQRLKRAGYTVRDNGVRSAPFYVLMGARMPAILVEIGYCSNKEEAKRLASSKYLGFITEGILQGIVGYKKSLTVR